MVPDSDVFRLACLAFDRSNLNFDPYRSPQSNTDESVASAAAQRSSWFVRVALYGHIAIVILTGVAMTHDSRSVIWSNRWQPLLEIALMVGAFGFLVCPVILIVAVLRSPLSTGRRLLTLGVGGAIWFAHFVALIPSVQ